MTTYSIVITEENDYLLALEPVSGVASQGKNLDEAMANISEALELFNEELAQDYHIATKKYPSTYLTTLTV
jgi:predicted RNase H-like HicB family nuclease